jgi:hypothetical protein
METPIRVTALVELPPYRKLLNMMNGNVAKKTNTIQFIHFQSGEPLP